MNIDSMIQGNPQALVTSYNGVLVADSLEVADRFGKRHTHVLRSIDDLINQLESQSTQNWADYFIPDDYQDNKNRSQTRQLSYEAAGRYVEKCNRELEEAQEELQAAWEAAGGVCPLCGSEVKENCTH